NWREFCLLNRAQRDARRGLIGRVFCHTQVSDAAAGKVLKGTRSLPDADQVDLRRRVIIPARPDRVLEQFLVSSLRRAHRIQSRASAVVNPAADDRLLLEIAVAGGRRWRRLDWLRRWS